MLIQVKILAGHYHSLLIKLTLSKIVISIIPNNETWQVNYDIGAKSTFSKL